MNSNLDIPHKSQQDQERSPVPTIHLLPEGTCDRESNKLLEGYKNLLNQPHGQSLVFPLTSNYSPWVIVKQTIPAQKQANNIGCNFMISKKQRPKKDEHIVGKLRGNFRNTEFFVYDNGENPKKKCSRNRKQLAYIRLNDDSIFSQSEGQKIEILIPSAEEENSQNGLKIYPREFTPKEEKQNLLLEEYKKKSSKVINLFEKQIWGQQNLGFESSSYSNASNQKTKNLSIRFQMNNAKNNFPVLSLNSRNRKTFALNFGYPLNMVQSFGIALALIERASS